MTTTTEINFLMYMALKELPFLAFAKSLEEWRWKVFSGMYPESQFQTMWEDIVFENMGLLQPVEVGATRITISVPLFRETSRIWIRFQRFIFF